MHGRAWRHHRGAAEPRLGILVGGGLGVITAGVRGYYYWGL